MPIFTPRGLKIRISVEEAFSLMARLFPETDAQKMLKTVEGLDDFPNFLAFVTGLICYVFTVNPVSIAVSTGLMYIVGVLITFYGFFIIPCLPILAMHYSIHSRVFLLALTFLGFIFVGWTGVLAFFIGKVIAYLAGMLIELFKMKKMKKDLGIGFSLSEINFFNSYKFYANQQGISNDITVTDDEVKEGKWIEAFEDFAKKHPEAVQRIKLAQ